MSEFKEEFELFGTTVGLVSSLGFFGFLLGLLISQAMLMRRSPTAPVLCGLSAATAGLALVAAAPSLSVLALGVFLASLSAGSVWTPFNDAVHRRGCGACHGAGGCLVADLLVDFRVHERGCPDRQCVLASRGWGGADGPAEGRMARGAEGLGRTTVRGCFRRWHDLGHLHCLRR